MKELSTDVLVIGSGPAGLAAAYQACRSDAGRVLVLDRNKEFGGILPQCIHNGFGLSIFQSDLTGPEYATRWLRQAGAAGAELVADTMVLGIEPGPRVIAVGPRLGLAQICTKSLVLAMGCRERPRGALAIPGTRPAGVYTAGTAQRLVNIEGYMPGRRFVILGSGDIGMIMARRLTLEGAEVMAMVEVLPYVSGLRRNLVQCVRDFSIPLQLRTTVTRVSGERRVEAVTTSQVDEQWRPVPGTQREIGCDTLLLSVGLIPENELSRMAGVQLDPVTGGPFVDERFATNIPGVYAAGNVVHVYDLVDRVTESALRAGQYAAEYARGLRPLPGERLTLQAGRNVRHVIPQKMDASALQRGAVAIELRVRQPVEEAVRVQVVAGEKVVHSERLRYARPSEMIALSLEPSVLPLVAKAGVLRVDVLAVRR